MKATKLAVHIVSDPKTNRAWFVVKSPGGSDVLLTAKHDGFANRAEAMAAFSNLLEMLQDGQWSYVVHKTPAERARGKRSAATRPRRR